MPKQQPSNDITIDLPGYTPYDRINNGTNYAPRVSRAEPRLENKTL